MSATPFFAYGNLCDEATYYGIVGRKPEWVPAVLPGYRVSHSLGYAWLVADEGSRVEGLLVQDVQVPDYWVLDDYHGTAQGLYVRREVAVDVDGEQVEACAYVGGPSMTHL